MSTPGWTVRKSIERWTSGSRRTGQAERLKTPSHFVRTGSTKFLARRPRGATMENQRSIPGNALAKTSKQLVCSIEKLVRQRLIRLAELIRKDGAPYPLTSVLVNLWVDVLVRAQIPVER